MTYTRVNLCIGMGDVIYDVVASVICKGIRPEKFDFA